MYKGDQAIHSRLHCLCTLAKVEKIPLMQSRAEHVIAKSAWKADNP